MVGNKHWRIGRPGSAAVAVRLVAFLAAAVAILTIVTTLVAVSVGHAAYPSALYALGGSAALIVLAALAVRPFDPLRG